MCSLLFLLLQLNHAYPLQRRAARVLQLRLQAAGALVHLSCLLAPIPHPVSRPAIAVAPHPNT